MEKNDFVLPLLVFWSFFKQRTVQIDQLLLIASGINRFASIAHNRPYPSGPTKHRASSSYQSDLVLRSMWMVRLGLSMIFCAWDSQKNPLFMPSNDTMQE